MPEICRFYGIIIKMFFDDHSPPHFHAEYSEHKVAIQIGSLSILSGSFPPRALGLVVEWASMHQEELIQNWQRAQDLNPIGKIDPLP